MPSKSLVPSEVEDKINDYEMKPFRDFAQRASSTVPRTERPGTTLNEVIMRIKAES